jgi:hypothetical protein
VSSTQVFSDTFWILFDWLNQLVWVWVLCYDRRSVGQSVLEWSTHLGLTTRFLLLSDSCVFVDVGRSLWLEDGSVVYNCCWPSPAQLFSGLTHEGFATKCYCLRLEISFCRLLRLAGSLWRYSTPPPHGLVNQLGVSTVSYTEASSYPWKFLCHKSFLTNALVIPW